MTVLQEPSSPPSGARSRFAAVQMLRGLAAAIIVVWHSDLAVELFKADFWRDTRPETRAALYPFWANHLNMGVDIFFCISGFVMALLAARARTARDAVSFLRDRIVRLAPPYWFFTFCLLALFFMAPHAFHIWTLTGDWSYDGPALVGSLLFLPQKAWPVFALGWSLVNEAAFYVFVFAVLLFRRGRSLPLFAGGAALIGAGLGLFRGEALNSEAFQSVYFIEFFMGTLAYAVHKPASKAAPVLQLVFAAALYLLVSLLLDTFLSGPANVFINVIGGGLFGFFLINGLIGVERAHKLSARPLGRFAVRLGDASYSLYLSHWFFLSLIGKLAVFWREAPWSFVVLWQIGAIAGAIGFGLWFFEAIEGPLHRSWKKKARSLTFPRARPVAKTP